MLLALMLLYAVVAWAVARQLTECRAGERWPQRAPCAHCITPTSSLAGCSLPPSSCTGQLADICSYR